MRTLGIDAWAAIVFLILGLITPQAQSVERRGNDPTGPSNSAHADSDSDAATDEEEDQAGTDSTSAADFPVMVMFITKGAWGYSNPTPHDPTPFLGECSWAPWWTEAGHDRRVVRDAAVTPGYLAPILEGIEFPETPPAPNRDQPWLGAQTRPFSAVHTSSNVNLTAGGGISSGLTSTRVWVKAPAMPTEQKFHFLKVKDTSTHTHATNTNTQAFISAESVDLVIPAGQELSDFEDLKHVPTAVAGAVVTSYERLQPLELIQDNMPNLGIAENSTDLGGNRGRMMIGVGGTAYITGEPATAELHAGFGGLPAAVSVEWRLEIRSERTQRGTLDDRNYPAQGYVTLAGNLEWDITATMNNEFVGGNCTLFYRVNGANADRITFRLRGKNPLDADARARIDASVGASFTAYAWGMAKHESRFGPRAFNQFNAGVTNGTPFYGAPNGWGMCQIDRPVGNPGVTTAEVWNWHTNVGAMNEKLVEKQAVYNRFIGYFRDSYGTNANWSEPPAAHTIGATTLPAEAWGVMVLYNGADAGVPQSEVPSHTGIFRSPWAFNPNNGAWTFHDNSQNYASGRVRPELEETVDTQE